MPHRHQHVSFRHGSDEARGTRPQNHEGSPAPRACARALDLIAPQLHSASSLCFDLAPHEPIIEVLGERSPCTSSTDTNAAKLPRLVPGSQSASTSATAALEVAKQELSLSGADVDTTPRRRGATIGLPLPAGAAGRAEPLFQLFAMDPARSCSLRRGSGQSPLESSRHGGSSSGNRGGGANTSAPYHRSITSATGGSRSWSCSHSVVPDPVLFAASLCSLSPSAGGSTQQLSIASPGVSVALREKAAPLSTVVFDPTPHDMACGSSGTAGVAGARDAQEQEQHLVASLRRGSRCCSAAVAAHERGINDAGGVSEVLARAELFLCLVAAAAAASPQRRDGEASPYTSLRRASDDSKAS